MATEGLQSVFNVLMEIRKERLRQEDIASIGKRWKHTCAHVELSNHERLAILAEEFGEVARALQEFVGSVTDVHDKDLRKELIQLAAVCAAWVQGLDADKAAK
jgi:NTP pyrophosphatase (non-canonical NTP hydrolase)